ncbi:hypothetical protein QQX10_13315 [Demequina sp. SYSU T00039]|uniref:DUF559 domain-containing protein n=1 Tax=Demequina lignilytica TaxID=3051663 RepID=A0AAW7M550_9MICO|nr:MULTISPECIES: hypothetical protein [unclassified Demequina]MDN4479140.1 hypothetical protein [Demequina sp. SYSU T00039-1]MDN4489147.1 hypothetical protein [Demequina sp. SYSU T00039]MDN4490250.1 hypothetical protein [Demequina sp. SYSU T00068]
MPRQLPGRLPPVVHRGDRSWTRAELSALTSARTVRTAIAAGEVVAVLPGRYVSAPHQLATVPRAHAAMTATRGVLTGECALFLRGVVDRPPRQILVAAARGRRIEGTSWLRTFQPGTAPGSTAIGELDIAWITEASLDAWSRGPMDRRVGAVLTALQRRALTAHQLREGAGARQRIRDRAGLENVIAAFESGVHSWLEHEAFTKVFTGAEFRRFVRQHAVIARGKRRYLDMFDPATMTSVELDGSRYHLAGEQREADAERDADLATLGISTLHFTYAQITRRPEWCRETVRAALRARARFAS